MLVNKSLSGFRLCEGADTSHGDSFPAQYIRIANKVAGTIHFEMLTHFLVVNIVHDESDDFVRFDRIHHAFAHIGDGITGVVASAGVFTLSQCGGATVDAAHEDILIAVLVGENAAGRGDALNIGQARLVRVLTQVPDNLPKADEGVIVQERGAVTAVFPNQFFKGIPRNFICNEDAKCATGKNDFSNVAADTDIVTHMKLVVIGIDETKAKL